MLYGFKYWVVKRQHIQEVCIVEMRILRWMWEVTRKYRKINFICELLSIASTKDKMRENNLR